MAEEPLSFSTSTFLRRMPLAFEEGVDKYETLRSHRLEMKEGDEPEPIEPGESVAIQVRGFYTTDGEGRTVQVEGEDLGIHLASIFNHAWELWVEPRIDEMEEQVEELPDVIRAIRIRLGEEEPIVEFNPPGPTSEIRLLPDSNFEPGDPIPFDDILDISYVDPPFWITSEIPLVGNVGSTSLRMLCPATSRGHMEGQSLN